jgi:putative pyruvate formate lyase activating enzyme
VLPNKLAGSFKIIDFLANGISPKTAINVMDQYQPCFKAYSQPLINRRPTAQEIDEVLQYAVDKELNVIS